MFHRGASFLCLCIAAMQVLQAAAGPVDHETRAHLEAKVMSEMSLKELESMVERDERVMNSPKARFIIIPKPKTTGSLIGEQERDAIVIERKPKKSHQQGQQDPEQFRYSEPYQEPYLEPYQAQHQFQDPEPYQAEQRIQGPEPYQVPEYRFDNDFDAPIRRSSFEPRFDFESAFRHEEDFPSLFKIADLESAGSSPVRQFYESIVESVMGKQKFGLDHFDALDIAASEDVPEYKPRFNYDAYSKDNTETKLQGKPYWKDTPERKEEILDDNGCRTVIKRVVDPEDEKKSSSEKAKSVVITKECESPSLNGPDAKISEGIPLRNTNSRFDTASSSGFSNYEDEPSSYQKTRPEELNSKQSSGPDSLAPDYIDSMLEKHFKSFPGFSNPLSSFSGYQERFKLRAPEAIKNVKPTIGVQTYEYTHPKSGFQDERQASFAKESVNEDAPRVYEHHYNYDYPEQSPRKPEASEYDDKSSEQSDSKDPKMMKKSFAYYRKDNPKSDPDDHQYAEEYAQGNYRSFSSSYDSEKDDPKKQQ